MNDNHLDAILKLDQDAFQREEPRTLQNLKGLRKGDPEGCFVLLDNGELVGYAFNKTMGDEGYLGPVGLKPSLQGNGLGQKLIKYSLNYLKGKCKVIGLEVRPEMGNNIGLYHKLGFHSVFPSFILELPEKLEKEDSKQGRGNKSHCDMNHSIELCSKMPEDKINEILDQIDFWMQADLGGISYKKDLELINSGDGDIMVISENDSPIGFITYYSIVYLHLWGVIKPGSCKKDILMELLEFFRKINPQNEVLLEVNTRYRDLTDFLLENGFKIRKSVNRMVLKGFEGEYFKNSSDFVMRAWHA